MELIKARLFTDKPPHDKTNKIACAPSEDSDQPGHQQAAQLLTLHPEKCGDHLSK